jgi:hypothetical protein
LYLQKEFADVYPFLKIEFFTNDGNRQNLYSRQRQVPEHLKLKDALSWKRQEGELEISDTMTVADLENVFIDQYGLPVEIFRRSGNIWLGTSITDNWTLKQQNEHGREITIGKKPAQAEPDKENDPGRNMDH